MSKSGGNAMAPEAIIKELGADVLRLWVAAEDYRSDVRLSQQILSHLVEAYRRLRNTARFLLGNLGDFEPARDALVLAFFRAHASAEDILNTRMLLEPEIAAMAAQQATPLQTRRINSASDPSAASNS